MKRTVALAILGVTAVTATSAFGQGQILFSNYGKIGGSYFPIVYDASLGGGSVGVADGVQIELWGAAGNVSSGLAFIANAPWSSFAGYTAKATIFEVSPYTSGQQWTLQFRASGSSGGTPVTGGSDLVVTTLADQAVQPPELPTLTLVPGFTVVAVPEPTTFALAGLGAAALLIFRRRD